MENWNKEKKYGVATVAIQNRMIECFKSMSIDEKRILIMASPIARNLNATESTNIFLSAETYATECEIKVNSAYKQIEQAALKLIDRSFSFINEKGKKVHSNWVIDATYEDAGINVRFTSIVLIMLKVLDKYNPYTKYNKNIALALKKDYSIDFYHLAKKHQKMSGFQLSIDEMFSEFGLPESYRNLSNLKKRVINPAISEISEHTDISLSYENIKKGRAVVGFKFIVEEKKGQRLIAEVRDQNTLDMFCNMTDAQIFKYSNILSQLHEISELSNHKDYQAFAVWISNILRDPTSVSEETATQIFKALHQKTDFKQGV